MKRAISVLLSILLVLSLSSAAAVIVHADDGDQIPISQFVADNHVLMTRADGRMIGWGDNTYGQLGLGDTAQSSYTEPVEITYFKDKELGKIRQIAVIKDTSFVLLSNGELYSAGSGTYGKHGQGDTYDKKMWGRVGGDLKIKKLYTNAAAEFAIAEDYNGCLYAWGKNVDGQLGVGDTDARTSPALVKDSANVKQLWCGADYVEYVDLDGNLYYWGKNDNGQLGLSSEYVKTTHNHIQYPDGYTKNYKENNEVVNLNPSQVLTPTLLSLAPAESITNLSEEVPPAPAKTSTYYTGFPIKTNDSLSTTNSTLAYEIVISEGRTIPKFMGSDGIGTGAGVHVYMGSLIGTVNKLDGKAYMSTFSGGGANRYTCKDWYTGVTETVGPSTSASNYLFRDAVTREQVAYTAAAGKIYYFTMSAASDYNSKSYNNIGLGVSQETYDEIMNNHGTGENQSWDTYEWEHRTILDDAKANLNRVLAGSTHAMTVIDGIIYGWGAADKKQLGTTPQTAYPVELAQLTSLIDSQKAAGVNRTGLYVAGNSNYITFDDGSVWVWGDNSYNKSGAEGAAVNIDTPTKVTALQDVKVAKVVAGRNTNYYITDTGDIYASGSNVGGVTGLGDTYADEATIDTPIKLETIGYSDTLTPPSAESVQITVPEKAESGKTINVEWNAATGAQRYELKRTVVLKDDDAQADDMVALPSKVEVTTMAFVPQKSGVSDILRMLSTGSAPQTVYTGSDTVYTDTANADWQSVSYELKAMNRIGDYSAPVLSSKVSIVTADVDDGDDNSGGNNNSGNKDSKVTVPPVNVTVNPPAVTIQSPDIEMRSPNVTVESPDISLSYPEMQGDTTSSTGTTAAAQSSSGGYAWMPTPEQLARLGLSFGGSSAAPYVITIEPSAPQYVPQDSSNSGGSTILYVIIFVLLTVLIGVMMFVVASWLFNKNGSEIHRIRYMLSSVLPDADD